MKPEELERFPKNLQKIWSDTENDILASIARSIARTGTLTSTSQYQLERLAENRLFNANYRKTLAKLLKTSEKEIDKVFEEAGRVAYNADSDLFKKAGIPFVPFEENLRLQQLVNAEALQTKEMFKNFTNSTALRVVDPVSKIITPVPEAFIRILDVATNKVLTGTEDYDSAMRTAINGLGDRGITILNYSSGRNEHVDVVVRRNVLTAIANLSGKISVMNAQDLGAQYYAVSAHEGARTDHTGDIQDHQSWQGKVYKINGSDKYENFYEKTGYGDILGLLGVNCRHTFSPSVFPDEDAKRLKEDLKIIQKADRTTREFDFTNLQTGEVETKQYELREALDFQREMERQMRTTRRKGFMAKEAGQQELYKQHRERYRTQFARYKNFIDSMNKKIHGEEGMDLRSEMGRVYLDGIGRL